MSVAHSSLTAGELRRAISGLADEDPIWVAHEDIDPFTRRPYQIVGYEVRIRDFPCLVLNLWREPKLSKKTRRQIKKSLREIEN